MPSSLESLIGFPGLHSLEPVAESIKPLGRQSPRAARSARGRGTGAGGCDVGLSDTCGAGGHAKSCSATAQGYRLIPEGRPNFP